MSFLHQFYRLIPIHTEIALQIELLKQTLHCHYVELAVIDNENNVILRLSAFIVQLEALVD